MYKYLWVMKLKLVLKLISNFFFDLKNIIFKKCKRDFGNDDCEYFEYGIPDGMCLSDGHYMCRYCIEFDYEEDD